MSLTTMFGEMGFRTYMAFFAQFPDNCSILFFPYKYGFCESKTDSTQPCHHPRLASQAEHGSSVLCIA